MTLSSDLYSDDQEWMESTIPGSDRPVRLVRLHVDDETKANLALVSFPVGWKRPQAGHYLVAEEFVVLRGSIHLNDIEHSQGDYVLIPAGATRVGSATPNGCLALAAFSGPPQWQPGAPEDPLRIGWIHCSARNAQRGNDLGFRGCLEAVEKEPESSTQVMDLLDLDTGRWSKVAPGVEPPAVSGPTIVRWW